MEIIKRLVNSKKAGVDRSYGRSLVQKLTFAIGHFLILLICVWLVMLDGWTTLGAWFGKKWGLADPVRARILLACAFLYWLRQIVTLFYLLQRKVDWSEVWGLLFLFASIEIGFLLLGGGAFRDFPIDLGWLAMIATLLLLSGSYLNTFSELQRKRWKDDPSNKGYLYTEGLFKHSMHINYFGDVVLFTGWCLFTHNKWALGLPIIMSALFIFVHIPGLDSHLSAKYGEEFSQYTKTTKKFIPFIY